MKKYGVIILVISVSLQAIRKKRFCVPLYGQQHEGVDAIRPEKGIKGKSAAIVTRMANMAINTAEKTGELCYIVLDAYFSTGPMFTILKTAANDKGKGSA